MSPKKNKFYLLATPASGKTFFIKHWKGKYKNLILHDLDTLKPYRDYRALDALPNNSVIFGGIAGKNLEVSENKDIYISVVKPEKAFIRNVKKRQLLQTRRRNWNTLETVLGARDELIEFSEAHNIPVFTTFKSALEHLNERISILS